MYLIIFQDVNEIRNKVSVIEMKWTLLNVDMDPLQGTQH